MPRLQPRCLESPRSEPGDRLEVSLQHRFPAGAVLDLAFAAPLPGVVTLFGPSGSGKSSLLQCIAGQWRPDYSRVRIGGEWLCDETSWRPPEQRRVGLVFQDAKLFPHLNVASNLRYGMRRAPPSAAGDPALPGFAEVVELLGLEPLLARRPRGLSGGERQRVAIGRALLSHPLLLAMDEPLAALDGAHRDEILSYLARLRARLRLPILYVTHAIDEVIRLADTLVLLRAGRVVACGPADAVLGDVDGELACRHDAACLLEGEVVAVEPSCGLAQVQAGGYSFKVPALQLTPGARVRLKIPAREVMLAVAADAGLLPPLSVQNLLPVRMLALREDPALGIVTVSLRPHVNTQGGAGGGILLAQVTSDSARRLQLSPGAGLLALVKSVSIEVMQDPG